MRDKEEVPMIELTRLNGSCLLVSCDLIKYADASPDTVLTLITGEKLVVLETCAQVQHLALTYRGDILRQAWPDAAAAVTAKIAFAAADSVIHQHH